MDHYGACDGSILIKKRPLLIGADSISQGTASMTLEIEEAVETIEALSVAGKAFESAAETFFEATAKARASTKAATKKVRGTLNSGAYNATYGISYGLVFGAVFLTELLPENSVFRRGLEDGAVAGLDAAVRKSAASRSKKRTQKSDAMQGSAAAAAPHQAERKQSTNRPKVPKA